MKQWWWCHRADWLKIAWIIPLVLLSNFTSFFSWLFRIKGLERINRENYFEIFLEQAYVRFDRIGIQMVQIELEESLVQMALPAMFTVLFGTYLYNELNVKGTYLFIRYRNRNVWYLKRCAELLLFSAIYSFLQVFSPFVWCLYAGGGEVTQVRMFLVAWTFLSYWAFNFFFALLVNLFAVEWGSVLGYISGYSVMIISYFLFNQRFFLNLKRACILPVRVTMLPYVIDETKPFCIFIKENKYQWTPLFVLIIYIMILLICGLVRIQYKDVGLYNQENLI